MKKSPNVYLAIDNQILLKGFEGLIKNQISDASIYIVEEAKDLFEINFQKDPEIPKILIYDANLKNEQTNLLLYNLLQTYPFLKTLILINEFDNKKIKFLFNVGIHGVLTNDISSEDFMDMFNDVLLGKKCLSPLFREQVIKQFCQKDGNFSNQNYTEFETGFNDEVDHVDQLFGLTKREKQILCLICNGKNTKEISEELYISLHTAETHRRNLLYKLDVKNTAEMVKVAVMSKLVIA
ncbi:MAG TPA: LuxR C-terminal-related transcriptional regulator [Moheibacter sp.]|nr:LuxR C-terminal-related transcriptional regulator [Moheibacter sp.]